ncbi:hypothetical protein M569_10241, partial [Genlisea aurea]
MLSSSLFSLNSRNKLKDFVSKSIALLDFYKNEKLIGHGKAFHCHLIKSGLSSENYLAVKLLIMYIDCRRFNEVGQMLKEFDGFNLVVHNCLISAHLQWGSATDACKVFDEMPERNDVSWTALISGLFRLGKADQAMDYFERNPFLDTISYTAAITGLLQNEQHFRSIGLYKRMVSSQVLPNHVTFTSILKACVELRDSVLGMCILGQIVKVGFDDDVCVSNSLVKLFLKSGELVSARKTFDAMERKDVVSWTTMLDLCFETGDLREARKMFDEMPERNEVTWSAMVSRMSQNGHAEDALALFRQMIDQHFEPNVSCYSSVINALASLRALKTGKSIHARLAKTGISTNVFIGCSLVDLYCRCGDTRDGFTVFDSIPNKNTVCWNSIVSGYSLNGKLKEATELFNMIPLKNTISWNSLIMGHFKTGNFVESFRLFRGMILSGQLPNPSTFSTVLSACANLVSLEKGKYAHTMALKLGFHRDVFVATALVDMYAKSGSIESSKAIFERLPAKNEVAWTAMIQGLAENGYGEEALNLFEQMKRTATSCEPNELIFLSVLLACSHRRDLVDRGLIYFSEMRRIHGIEPDQRHYTCVVDMLSRSGRLREAEELAKSVSYETEANAWAALLRSCRVYGDGGALERRVGERLSELAGRKPEGLVLLSNAYAEGGKWEDVVNVRDELKRRG